MDFAEGLMLSLKGQEKENKNENSGVIVRLMTLAIDKLHAALKAVPDDTTTKYALADAYQTLAFAVWTAPPYLQSSHDSSHEKCQLPQQQRQEQQHQQSHIISKGFELYRSLICDEAHTRCSKLKLSYRGTGSPSQLDSDLSLRGCPRDLSCLKAFPTEQQQQEQPEIESQESLKFYSYSRCHCKLFLPTLCPD